MLKLENISYRIGSRLLLDDATASLVPGHRIGLVGRNGTGKTTLLKLIIGNLDLDTGSISSPKNWRIGMTVQEAPEGNQALIDFVVDADMELKQLSKESEIATDSNRISEIHERLREKEAYGAHARASKILAGLGFDQISQQRSLNNFSGGWRMRVMLASLLFTEPDVLLLDEPTNHLDLEATLWLEEYLRRYKGTALIVSHDRSLLNRVAQEILHLENTKLTLYKGNYDQFEARWRLRFEQNERAQLKQAAQRAHIQKFIDRFRYKATKARQAQSRIKMLERMEPIPENIEGPTVTFNFPDPKPALAPPLFSVLGAAVGYNGIAILDKLSLRLDQDDRIGLVGANGNGKSTLIKLLAGRLKAMSGEVTAAPKLRVGYFAQQQTEELNTDGTPFTELAHKRPGDSGEHLRNQLGRFGFSQNRADTPIKNLSGGEKARLLFALITADRPHVLLLDEPTNHLDVDSRQALIQAINGFAGAVVIVSHDPHVLQLTADRFWLAARGRVIEFDGDIEEYRSLVMSAQKHEDAKDSTYKGKNPNDKRKIRKILAAQRQSVAPLRKHVQRLEKEIEMLQTDKILIEKKIADPRLYERAAAELVTLQKDLARVVEQLNQAEEAWIVAQQELETALL